MNYLSICIDLVCGWAMWSLSHNLGHRWWHVEMRHGMDTPYAHGEREHHRIYDRKAGFYIPEEDPKELFISFPISVIAPIALLFVAAFGWMRGWEHCVPFAIALYGSMITDHQLHKLFHKSADLDGVLGRLQEMHLVHHTTHQHNFFFVTGWVWDFLLGTARSRITSLVSKHAA